MTGWWHLIQAREALETGAYERAARSLEESGSDAVDARMQLAYSYYRLERYEEALALWRQIKSDDPALMSDVYYNMGNGLVRLGRLDEAKRAYLLSLMLAYRPDADANLLAVEQQHKKVAASGSGNERQNAEAGTGESAAKKGEGSGESGGKPQSKKEGKESSAGGSKPYPLSYRYYETLNQGGADETHPW